MDVIGLVAGYAMARRGHQPLAWWALGAIFGPLMLVLAIEGVLGEKRAKPQVLRAGMHGGGSKRVLVGIDGSPESRAALLAAMHLIGSEIGEVTLAGVVPFEGELPGVSSARHLAEAATGISPTPTTIQLTGDPASELADLGRRDLYDLLAIGTRGRGLSPTLLGSVARKLLQKSAIPLLVVNPLAATSAESTSP